MQVAELLVLASGLAFMGVGAAVAVKLLRLARRTRGLPETLAGTSLFLLSAVSWPLLLVVSTPEPPSAWVLRAGWAAAALAMAVGWSGVFLFTWQVFRPGPGWARTLAGVGIAVELAAAMALAYRAVSVPDPIALQVPSACGLVLLLGAETVYAWTAIESFRYRALLRRRIPLGLADPVVADRFGLWGYTVVFAFGSLAPAVFAHLTGGDPNSQTSHLMVGVFGLASSLTLYLAFLPPAAYRRFVIARAPLLAEGMVP
jgi:hypothetical protein